MRTAWVLLAALAALAAYYIYLPLPGTVSDSWKLMLLDATFRAVQQTCHLIHYLRLSHHLIVLNYLICTFDKLKSVSSEPINITDVVFDGVEVRVFEPPAKEDEPLKRGVVYIHGGGWALASASTCLLVTNWDSGLVSSQQEEPKLFFLPGDDSSAETYLNSVVTISILMEQMYGIMIKIYKGYTGKTYILSGCELEKNQKINFVTSRQDKLHNIQNKQLHKEWTEQNCMQEHC